MLTYHNIVHKTTGQNCYFPAGKYGNYLKACRRTANYIQIKIPKYYCCHVTLTSALPRMDCFKEEFNRARNYIGKRLQSKNSVFKYIAVKEIQRKRAEKYGDIVIHYHMLVYYSKAYAMPSAEDINKSWGLGSVTITAPKVRAHQGRIAVYLGKYLGKEYNYEEELKERNKFTSSQTPALYALSMKRLLQAMEIKLDRPLKIQGRKIYYLDDPLPPFNASKIYIYEFLSDWRYLGIVTEPF